MNKYLLMFAAIVSASGALSAQRLPELAVPENYKLSFAPNFAKDNFAGDETISARVLKATDEIVLNSAEIDFGATTITTGGKTQNATVTTDKNKEFATLKVPEVIPPGAATIHIVYTGILNGDLRGFYLGKQENGKKYAVTQFESTDARRAFPSFDEPAYKATAEITVIAPKGEIAISNREIVSDTPGPGPDQHTVKFAKTAKMSSYLYAVAVGDFEYIEGSADGIPIRVYTFPGRKQQGAFALETAEHCIRFYDHYFGVKYAFTKLDLIGLPDFAAGAMENAGAITFREASMLIDPERSSTDQRKNVAITVAHEIAHQWFGDLVTMQWWDDIWLNEGFATWMESKPVEAWKPEWNVNLDDVLGADNTMNVDSLMSTRPIHQAAETPNEIQELFDGIAYGKAAAVLNMLEAYLGPETFRQGVVNYIKQHEYGNSTASDFWTALTAASNKPVDTIMPTFVEQAGLPIISAKAQCSGATTTVTLKQTRYFSDRSLLKDDSKELWKVPVCLKVPAKDGKSEQKCELLTGREQQFSFPGCTSWVMANAGATGYYHSSYEGEAVRAMAGAMQSQLSPAERIQLISDEWASVRVNLAPIADFMVLSDDLKSEHNSVVMTQGTAVIRFIGDNLVPDADRESFRSWARQVFGPLTKELGWQPASGDSEDRKALRAAAFAADGYIGRDPAVLREAAKLAHDELQKPGTIDPSMADTVFELAAVTGDAQLYDQMVAAMPKAKSPEEYYRLGGALTDFTDPKLTERTLASSLTPAVRTQDAPFIIAATLRNPAARTQAWDFVRAHWTEIDKMMIGFSAGTVVGATGSFCDPRQRDEVKSFFAEHAVPAAERTLKQSLERIDYCIDIKDRQASQVASWLQGHGTANGLN